MNPRPPKVRSIALYRDVEATLNAISDLGKFPAEVRCSSPEAAIRWRQRAHTTRRIMQEQEEARIGLPAGTGSSMYDALIFSLSGSAVVVTLRDTSVKLVVDGKVIPVTQNDELEALINEPGNAID